MKDLYNRPLTKRTAIYTKSIFSEEDNHEDKSISKSDFENIVNELIDER